MSERVKSPCVSVCVLDNADICIGCYRHANEIVDWMVFSEEKKKHVLARCARRAQDSGRIAGAI